MDFVWFESVLGQHNDARMNLAIALTAVRYGASVANHTEVLSLLTKNIKTGKTTQGSVFMFFYQKHGLCI